jgi:hypothetical protein
VPNTVLYVHIGEFSALQDTTLTAALTALQTALQAVSLSEETLQGLSRNMASAFAKEFDVSKIASPATQASNTKNACDTEVRPNDRHSDRSPAEVRTSSNNPQQQEQHGSSQDNNGTSSRDPTDKALSQVPKSVSAEVATPALSKFFQSTLAGQRDNRTRQASQDAANVHIELDDNNSDWTDDSSSKRVDNDSMDNVQSPGTASSPQELQVLIDNN